MYSSHQEINQQLQSKIELVKRRIEFIESLNLDKKEHDEIISYLQTCIDYFSSHLHNEAI